MKTKILTLASFLFFVSAAIGQVNPVQNLTWDHWYEYGNNFFTLEWDEPAAPHDEILGYNVYQEDHLFIFIDEGTSIFNIYSSVYGIVSNCGGESFLFYNNGEGFEAHVTAVYAGNVESDYTETVFVGGPLLNIDAPELQKAVLYPNPTTGILNIENTEYDKIMVYDLSGRKIKSFEPRSQIDLSDLSSGIYTIQLISASQIQTQKVILE